MGRACRVKERSDWHRICKSIIFLKYFFRGALPLTPQPSKHTKTPHLVVQPGEMELLNLNLFNRLVSSTSLGNKLIYAQP